MRSGRRILLTKPCSGGYPLEVRRVVDEFEDAKSQGFHRLQQSSIGDAHLIETMHVENEALVRSLRTALGAGAPLCSGIFRFNNLQIYLVELCGNDRCNFIYIGLSEQ